MSQSLIYSCFILMLIGIVVERFHQLRYFRVIYTASLLIFMAFLVAVTQYAYDVEVYRRIYERLIEPPLHWRVDLFPEYGFQLFNYIANGVFGLSFEAFRFFFALVTIVLTYIFSRFHTDNRFMFLYLYYPKYFLIGVVSHVRSAFIYPFLM